MESQAAFEAFSEQYNALDRERFGPPARSLAPPQKDESSGSAIASAATAASAGGVATAATDAAAILPDALVEADAQPLPLVLSDAGAPDARAVAGGDLESSALVANSVQEHMESQAAFEAFSAQYNALDRERFGPPAQSLAPPEEDESSGSASASAATAASAGRLATAANEAAAIIPDALAAADAQPLPPTLSEAGAPDAHAVASGDLDSSARGPMDSARVMHAEQRDADSDAAEVSSAPSGTFSDDSTEWTAGQSPLPAAARSGGGSTESDTVVLDGAQLQMAAEWGSDDDDDDEWQGLAADEPSNALPADDEYVGELDAAHVADDTFIVHGMDSYVRSSPLRCGKCGHEVQHSHPAVMPFDAASSCISSSSEIALQERQRMETLWREDYDLVAACAHAMMARFLDAKPAVVRDGDDLISAEVRGHNVHVIMYPCACIRHTLPPRGASILSHGLCLAASPRVHTYTRCRWLPRWRLRCGHACSGRGP